MHFLEINSNSKYNISFKCDGTEKMDVITELSNVNYLIIN